MALKYSTTLQLNSFIGLKSDIPEFVSSSSSTNETVGTGDDSETIFWLDHNNVIANTYTLYYGSAATATTTLTETTHYALDKEKGKITLTTAGVTLLSTNNIYALYAYNSQGLTDSFLNDTLLRAEQLVDNALNTSFTDGTATNPSYPSRVEYQVSKGSFDRTYFSERRPLIDVSSLLDGAITAADVTLDVTSGEGENFPTSGSIIIGSEIISYTGVSTDTLTGLTRGVGDSTAAIHSDGVSIHTSIVEISGTEQGTSPTWNTLLWDSEVTIDKETGKIFIYDTALIGGVFVTNGLLSKQDVANRFKITYFYGWDSIPVDVTRLTLLFAAKDLMNLAVRKAHISGQNSFEPSLVNVDLSEIDRLVSVYREIPMGNT